MGEKSRGNFADSASNNLPGLCLYCSQSSVDSTDTCCYNAKAESRCVGIKLPKITDLPPLLINSTTNATANPSPDSSSKGLSGGAIAGITIGTLLGVGLLAGLFLLLLRRRRQSSPQSPTFNQPRPSHSRSQPSMSFTAVAGPGSYHGRGYEVLGGGRVARMSALERGDGEPSSPGPVVISHRNAHNSSSSDFSRDPYRSTARPLGPPPRTRNASLSSTSIMMESSPSTGRGIQTNPSLASGSQGFPSPGGMTTQSEQLAFFKDYYSPGDIHPGDKVSTLWAYAPRAPDEFELERGEMLKVVGIWDDGWATGIRLEERAEDFGVAGHDSMRDSGVSGGKDSGIAASAAGRDGLGSRGKDRRDEMDGVVKAFPLVCVCLPEVWGKMVESGGHEGSERAWEEYRGSGSSGEEAETEGVSGKKVTEKFSRSGGIGSP